MLTLFPSSLWKQSLSRRQALKMSALAGGAALPHTVARAAEEHGIERERATAKRCIFLFLCGGPSQPDLWDLKLDAPAGVRTAADTTGCRGCKHPCLPKGPRRESVPVPQSPG